MSDRLNSGDSLAVGGSITSQDGRFMLILQADGNLVLYQSDGFPRWETGNVGTVSRVIMQADGNLVLYGPTGPLWATSTEGHPGSYLSIQDDGNVVIYGPGGAIWTALSTIPNLTGTWAADGGVYYIRHLGDNTVWWAGLSGNPSAEFHTGLAYTNVFQGRLDPVGRTIVGSWTDVPRGGNAGHGSLGLDIVQISTGGGPGVPSVLQLRQNPVGTTGGFGPTVWQQAEPWQPFDVTYKFARVQRYDGPFSDNNYELKDHAVVIGTIQGQPTLSWDESNPRQYCTFVRGDTSGLDGDLTFDIDGNVELDPQFWAYGWIPQPRFGLYTDGASSIEALDHFNAAAGRLHCEVIMFGRTNPENQCMQAPEVLLPGWNEVGGNSVVLNGQPVNGRVDVIYYTQDPRFYQIYVAGVYLAGIVRVTGVMNLDSHADRGPPYVGALEVHPVYSIEIVQDFGPPSQRPQATLSGVWHCEDIGTYYIRQLDDGSVWWLGLSGDQGQSFANVFRGSIVYVDNEGVPLRIPVIDGGWTDVPLGIEPSMSSGKLVLEWSGGLGGINTATTLTASLKTGGFGGSTWTKLYDR